MIDRFNPTNPPVLYLNIYPRKLIGCRGVAYETRADADAHAGRDRIACKEILIREWEAR